MTNRYSAWQVDGRWLVIDSQTQDSIFGDRYPRDEREAEQCARAANIAHEAAVIQTKDTILNAIR